MLQARRHILAGLLMLGLLGGCGSPAAPAPSPAPSPTVPPAPTPMATRAPTAAPTVQPTLAPSPVPTALPTAAPTFAPTAAPTAVPTAPAPEPTHPSESPAPAPAPAGGEVLFLRGGALVAYAPATSTERTLADHVLDFAASPDGAQIALIREVDRRIDLWLVRRDGSGLAQLTRDGPARVEATPAWSGDGGALAYAASDSSDPYPRSWPDWALWCSASEVRVRDMASGGEATLGRGCDPALSPDGRRLAFATPPTAWEPGITNGPTIANTIRLVNRRGERGWNFAVAAGADAPPPHTGRLVYAPAFAPDGGRLAYHRFLGYRALVDIDLSEIGGSFEGKGKPFAAGAGWLLPARFAPNGRDVALIEHNYSDARGFGGADNWSVTVVRLGEQEELPMPDGPMTFAGRRLARLPRAQAAAWSPEGAALAVLLPAGWRPGLSPSEPFGGEQPGEIWRWTPGGDPAERLVSNVDFASPVAWLR
jgi:hypothetical protein